MGISKREILGLLEASHINYECVEHDAIYTVKDGEQLNLPNEEAIAKNLFICDDKKQSYYLVSLLKEKQTDLKELRNRINSRRLCFASESDLESMLKLQAGAVTPFGVLNDSECRVKLLLDKEYDGGLIGVPLNDNRLTIWLQADDLFRIIKQHGNDIEWIEV